MLSLACIGETACALAEAPSALYLVCDIPPIAPPTSPSDGVAPDAKDDAEVEGAKAEEVGVYVAMPGMPHVLQCTTVYSSEACGRASVYVIRFLLFSVGHV